MAKANLKKKLQFWGTGRRKKAIARVRLIPSGSGAIVINDRRSRTTSPWVRFSTSSSSPSLK